MTDEVYVDGDNPIVKQMTDEAITLLRRYIKNGCSMNEASMRHSILISECLFALYMNALRNLEDPVEAAEYITSVLHTFSLWVEKETRQKIRITVKHIGPAG
jgi:hypothetical protein